MRFALRSDYNGAIILLADYFNNFDALVMCETREWLVQYYSLMRPSKSEDQHHEMLFICV